MGFYANPTKWYSLFEEKRYGLLINVENKPVGFIDLQIINADEAHIAYYIAPSFRQKGFGKEALVKFEEYISKDKNIKSIHAFVEPDNISSNAILVRFNYEASEVNEEKMIPYHKSLKNEGFIDT